MLVPPGLHRRRSIVPREDPDVNSRTGPPRELAYSAQKRYACIICTGVRSPAMYKYCDVQREGYLLVVTLNRPEVLNSLNAPACFELDEIFDEFERDSTLWI